MIPRDPLHYVEAEIFNFFFLPHINPPRQNFSLISIDCIQIALIKSGGSTPIMVPQTKRFLQPPSRHSSKFSTGHKAQTMVDSSKDMVALMNTMNLAPGAGCEPPDRRMLRDREGLGMETQNLIKAAQELLERAIDFQALNIDEDVILSRRLAALKSIMDKSEEIASLTQATTIATTDCVVSQLFSLANGDHDAHDLLSCFRSIQKTKIEAVLRSTAEDRNLLLSILEQCYGQSLSSGGDLHINNYFEPLHEAALCSPYDPDFEAEQYYNHEDRLQTDQGYAQAEGLRQQRSCENRVREKRRKHRAWMKFWIQALEKCTGGPTLFWSLTSDGLEELPKTPRYLFRTSDSASSGYSDDEVVASPATSHTNFSVNSKDLLSFEREVACEKLCAHLEKDCFGTADCTDNLMSWSSSLLFVIQYAFWRCHHRHCSPVDVKICVVDTKNFLCRQFDRDLWLLKKFHKSTDECPKMRHVMGLRDKGFDNGEYLSQGIVCHKHKSWVVTLEKIIQSRLCDLCPEFETKKEQWTKRVHELRLKWASLHSTTRNELQVAMDIAGTCFQGVGAFNIAILLLRLKNREYQGRDKTGRRRLTDIMPHDRFTERRIQISACWKGTILWVSRRMCRDIRGRSKPSNVVRRWTHFPQMQQSGSLDFRILKISLLLVMETSDRDKPRMFSRSSEYTKRKA